VGDSDAESAVIAKELWALVEEETAKLGLDKTKLLEMIRDGYSQEEIAKKLNLTENGVKKQWQKLRERLRAVLRERHHVCC